MSFGIALLLTAKAPFLKVLFFWLCPYTRVLWYFRPRLKGRRFDSNKAFKTGNLHCFPVDWLPGQGLICTRPNTMALRAPFATGSSPSNETFWLCLPTLLLGNPWVACSYSVVFSFSLSLSSLTRTLARGTPIPFCWEEKTYNYLKRLRQYAQLSPFLAISI